MPALRETMDDDGKTQQILSSAFPELSDPYLVSEKVEPFLGQCQSLGLRRRNPRKVLQKRHYPKRWQNSEEGGIIPPKGQSFFYKVE